MANSKSKAKAKAAPVKKAVPKKKVNESKPLRTPRKRNDPDFQKRPTSQNRSKDELNPKKLSGEPIEQDQTFKPPTGEPAVLSDEDTGAGTGDEFLNETKFNEEAPEAQPPTHLVDAPMKREQNVRFDNWYKDFRNLALARFGYSIHMMGEIDSDKVKVYYENGETPSGALEKEQKKHEEWQEIK